MKRKLSFYLFCGLLTLGLPLSIQAQIRGAAKFIYDLERDQKTGENGEMFTTLEYPGCYVEGKEGSPALPYKYLQYIVPDGPASYTVQVVSTTDEISYVPYRLWPAQKPIVPSIYKKPDPFVMPDLTIYHSKAAYPKQIAEVVGDGYFDGNKRIITVKVCPVQYYPLEGDKIIFHKNVNMLITADLTQSEAVNPIKPIHSSIFKSDDELKNELNFLENMNDILTYARQQDHSSSSGIELNLPAYEYTIIAPAAYARALERLVFWKKMKGMTAGVVTLESILYHPDIKGDEVSKIYDDAGKVRHYLTYAYQQGAKYVFLVGRDVPFRYSNDFMKIPTDLYYSDLNGSWANNEDENYSTSIDYLPELYVGRITCKNITELNNYLYKLFCYEKNPGYGDNSYLGKSFYTQADNLQEELLANKFAGAMMPSFTNCQIFQEEPSYNAPEPTFPKGKDVIDEINKHYGFVGFYNHGYDFGMGISTIGSNDETLNILAMIDSYDNAFKNPERGNGVDCLTNIGYPFVVYSVSCSTMPYDKISDISYNLGEAFTVMGKYGAVAYLGYTRDSHINKMDIEFASYLIKSENRLGVAEAKSKMTPAVNSWEKMKHNLLGCPELQLWQGKPQSYPSVEIVYEDNYLVVRPQPQVPKCYVNMVGLFEAESYIEQRYLYPVLAGHFQNPPKNYIITINKPDHSFYIAPLYLQNESITGKYNLFDMNYVFLGNHVDERKAVGDFVIKNGGQLSIEYSDEVILDSGFEVETGAIFELKPIQE